MDNSDQFVPGHMYCAKCDLELVRTNLNVNQGTASAGDNKTEPCPNGCGPLWPVTWKRDSEKAWDTVERLFKENEELKAIANEST